MCCWSEQEVVVVVVMVAVEETTTLNCGRAAVGKGKERKPDHQLVSTSSYFSGGWLNRRSEMDNGSGFRDFRTVEVLAKRVKYIRRRRSAIESRSVFCYSSLCSCRITHTPLIVGVGVS